MQQNLDPNSKSRHFYQEPRFYLTVLVVLGLFLAIFFAFRAFHGFQRMRGMKFGGGETNVELIRPWMTVNYITKMYHVPPDVVLAPLGLPVEGNNRRDIGSLIRSTGTSNPEEMLERIKESINSFQQKDLIPTPPNSQPPEKHP